MAALNVVAPGGRGFCSSMQLPVSRHPSYTVLCCSESPARSLRTKLSPASRATRRRYSDDQLVSAATPSPPKSSNHPRLQPKDGIVDTVLLRYDKPSKQAGLRTSKQDENTKADDEVATRRQKAKKQESPDDVVAWKLHNVKVLCSDDEGKDDHTATVAVASAASQMLHARETLPASAVVVLRKAYDPRPPRAGSHKRHGLKREEAADPFTEPSTEASTEGSEAPYAYEGKFSYTLLIDEERMKAVGAKPKHVRNKTERITRAELATLMHGLNASIITSPAPPPPHPDNSDSFRGKNNPIIIVGAGPAGLFAALSLASRGHFVKLLERGKAVEDRGRDIGALMVRRKLNPESNLCFGEGGAGTWSDGKLTTKVGRNGSAVRAVLNTLVHFGGPENILTSGKPHLGTDRLVRILRRFRQHLLDLGAEVHFDSRVDSILTEGGHACGVKLANGKEIKGNRVIIAPGHSARGMYKHLIDIGVKIEPKPFSVGFRIEHPQELVDSAQYGEHLASKVLRGKGKVPVADYALAANVGSEEVQQAVAASSFGDEARPYEWLQGTSCSPMHSTPEDTNATQHSADVPSTAQPSATAQHATQPRNVYSFCMCPGGQVVPTSVQENELCVNGMSFSRRDSKWANSALVVAVGETDWQPWVEEHGVLAGEAMQRHIEARASKMSPEHLRAPAQRVVDFLTETVSENLPKTSYRLGVHSAPLHTLYSPELTAALQQALLKFPRKIQQFLDEEAVLIGVETRTSAPVRIVRDDVTLEAEGLGGLFPCGEGAGYAGGIVSAAVEGIRVAAAVSGDEHLLELVGGSIKRGATASAAVS